MTVSPPARAAAVLILLWSSVSAAEPWSGAEPGTTTLAQVLRSFGPPTRRTRADDEVVLTYQRKDAPAGTRAVRFLFAAGDDVLRRVEVTPARPSKRGAIEALYGPACDEDTSPGTACHEREQGPARQTWLHYRSRGLSVLVDRMQRVKTLAYVAPESPRAAGVAAAGPAPAAPMATAVPAVATQELVATSATEPTSGLAPVTVVEDTPDGAASGSELPPGPVAMAPSEAGPTTEGASSAGGRSDGVIPGWSGAGGESSSDAAWAKMRPDKPVLAVGGFLYQRAELVGVRSQRKTSLEPSFPSLVDIYLDANPSQRVRGFTLGRLAFDPLDAVNTRPDVILGQLWLKFDIARTLYVTAGRQEVRWGSSQVWRPTDFLQDPNPDPLNRLDLRTGVDMVKVTLPWESMATNLSVIGTTNLAGTGPDDRSVRYGGAVRAEMALGTAEIIASAAFQQSRRPQYGLDLSMGAGLLDFNAELALVRDSDVRLWARNGNDFVQRTLDGPKLRASAGVSAQLSVADIYRVILRAEGFYNPLGYDDRAFLGWLSTQGDFRALYFGRYYAMGQVNVGRRGNEQLGLTFTTLANVRDSSFLSRLDFQATPFDAVEIFVQTYIEVPYGERGSEFRFEAPVADPSASPSGIGVFRAGMSLQMRM